MARRDVGLRRLAMATPRDVARDRSDGTPACAYMPATARSVGDARRFVRSQLPTSLPDRDVDAAVLVVGELAANSVVHAGTPYCVRVWKLDHGFRIEVADDHAGPLLEPGPVDRYAVGGRGLTLVADLVMSCGWSWGWTPEPGGKAVWFEFGQPALSTR